MTRATRWRSPLGELTLIAEGTALIAVEFGREAGHGRLGGFGTPGDEVAPLRQARQELAEYFAGRRTRFDLALAPRGTPFQLRVWDELRRIPHGVTRTYGEIARAVGSPGAVRAVGAACARNPLAIVVPCHRVVGARGRLTGYAGGLARKQALLDLEAAVAGASAGR